MTMYDNFLNIPVTLFKCIDKGLDGNPIYDYENGLELKVYVVDKTTLTRKVYADDIDFNHIVYVKPSNTYKVEEMDILLYNNEECVVQKVCAYYDELGNVHVWEVLV